MKRRVIVLRAFLLVAVFASFVACGGGTFYDPGPVAAGPGLGGGDSGKKDDASNKPAKLSSSASYSEAMSTITKIIDYCDKNPGTANDETRERAEQAAITTQSEWNTYRSDMIEAINSMIDDLE
ncbi:MAG: hypothetical protein LBK61_04655 [Spirochaetaceae bacterium]|jgi:hypothetical protein|nr:hypothetical protein [Spirochaetaceae bacterium]